MLKTFQTILFATAVLCYSDTKGQYVEFPLDTNPVVIDGILSASEWQNAASIMIPVNSTDNVQVRFKHDNTAMYFAFSGKLESANALFPEVLTDANNTGGNSWSSGQWWLHVSATDCENDGGYGVYNNCMAVQPDWEGAPNFAMGPPVTDTVEMRIPFSKVGFNPGTMDTMGLVMMVTNTASIFKTYPTTADRNTPSTWGKATFSKYPVGVGYINRPFISVYPNPAKNIIRISGLNGSVEVKITDVAGRVIKRAGYTGNTAIMHVDDLYSGTYYIHVSDSRAHYSEVVYINK